MQEIELSAGIIEYEDTGGSGPIVVLLHGLAMDGSLWRKVVQELRNDHRCVVPTMPLGSHRRPMRADADLSPHGIANYLWVDGEAIGSQRDCRRLVTSIADPAGGPPRSHQVRADPR